MHTAERKPNNSFFARILAAVSALAFCLALSGCRSEMHERELFAMDTFMSLRVYGGEAESALGEISELITRLDGLLSVTNDESELSRLNRAGKAEGLSPETFDIIRRALEFSESAGACFDVTLRPVMRAWGFTGGKHRIPSADELSSLLEKVGDGGVVLDSESRSVTLPDGAELDLGALAKGYAADEAAKLVNAGGCTGALLNLGSSTILAIGSKPDKSKWRIAVKDPAGSDAAGVVAIEHGAVSTSGGYERCFTGPDGRTYWHIIDPRTGLPASNGIVSVTVLTEDAFTGDGLSTALFVMGPEDAEKYRRTHGGFEFIMLMEDGSIFLTPEAAKVFTPQGAYAQAEIVTALIP